LYVSNEMEEILRSSILGVNLASKGTGTCTNSITLTKMFYYIDEH
jgi:hypothetical protein